MDFTLECIIIVFVIIYIIYININNNVVHDNVLPKKCTSTLWNYCDEFLYIGFKCKKKNPFVIYAFYIFCRYMLMGQSLYIITKSKFNPLSLEYSTGLTSCHGDQVVHFPAVCVRAARNKRLATISHSHT